VGAVKVAPRFPPRMLQSSGLVISIVVPVYNQLDLTRACLESLRGTSEPFELAVVDNASSDGTEAFFRRWTPPFALRYRRNARNVGLIQALNQGAELAGGDTLCFLHNDTVMHDLRWLARLGAALEEPGVGLVGLYGAQRLRRDGRYVGRTLVHALAGTANVRGDLTEVAAVDGVCLAVRRSVLDEVGGFDEGYGFFHGYDRDLSFAVREAGRRCVVVDTPFTHRGGGTRTGAAAPFESAADLAQRRAALARFAAKWSHRLPADVRTASERLADWLAVRAERLKRRGGVVARIRAGGPSR
jgi:GT2 family glycosyltransferase